MANIEGELADFVVAEYNANPTFIENLVSKGEGALESFLGQVLTQVHVGGIVGIVLPAIEGGVEKAVANLIASHTPQEIYAYVGSLLSAEAHTLGG